MGPRLGDPPLRHVDLAIAQQGEDQPSYGGGGGGGGPPVFARVEVGVLAAPHSGGVRRFDQVGAQAEVAGAGQGDGIGREAAGPVLAPGQAREVGQGVMVGEVMDVADLGGEAGDVDGAYSSSTVIAVKTAVGALPKTFENAASLA